MKDKTIFIITRYSMLTGGVQLSRGVTQEEHISKLFSDDRMNNRLALFKTITAESLSLMRPCDADLHFVILTSDLLPDHHANALNGALFNIEQRSDFKCAAIYAPAWSNPRKHIDDYIQQIMSGKTDQVFATVRLDDDDGLASSYCKRLCGHLDRGAIGYPISFAYGYEGIVDEFGGVIDIRKWYCPKIALGLAHTNAYTEGVGYLDDAIHVYRLGNHTKIDLARPVIVDSVSPSFFRAISSHNDSGDNPIHGYLPALLDGDFDTDEFGFLKISYQMENGSDENFHPSSMASSQLAKSKLVASNLAKKEKAAGTPSP